MSALAAIDWGRLGEDAQGVSVFDDLTPAGRDFVRLHAEVIHLLARELVGQDLTRERLGSLAVACAALKAALTFAMMDAKLGLQGLFDLLGEADERFMEAAAEDGPELTDLLEAIARGVDRLNRRLARQVERAGQVQAGPAYAEYLGATAVVDALTVLLAISMDRHDELAQWRIAIAKDALALVKHAEGVALDAILLTSLAEPEEALTIDANAPPRTGLTVEILLKAIDLGFANERLRECRQLIELGLAWFPAEAGLLDARSKYGPPTTGPRLSTGSAAARARSREWLRDNAGKHGGQWVAVADGRLLGAADDLTELRHRIGDVAPGTLLVRVQ